MTPIPPPPAPQASEKSTLPSLMHVGASTFFSLCGDICAAGAGARGVCPPPFAAAARPRPRNGSRRGGGSIALAIALRCDDPPGRRVYSSPIQTNCTDTDGNHGPFGPALQQCGPAFSKSGPPTATPRAHLRDLSCALDDPGGPVWGPVHGMYPVC